MGWGRKTRVSAIWPSVWPVIFFYYYFRNELYFHFDNNKIDQN